MFFFLAVPKNFVGEAFCAAFQKSFGNKIFLDKRRGESIKIFHQNFFGLTVPKIFVEEQFYVSKKLGIETF